MELHVISLSFILIIVSTSCPTVESGTLHASRSCVDYPVYMSDLYGDGWNGAVLHIGSHKLTMTESKWQTSSVCLESDIYTPYCCGHGESSFDEVWWKVGNITGGANETCVGTAGSFTVVSTFTPTLSPAPSNSPILNPSSNPTPNFSSTKSIKVSNQAELRDSISSNATIELVADILLSSTLDIHGVRNIEIIGRGHRVHCGNSTRCWRVTNSNNVSISDMTVSEGTVFGYGQFGGGAILVIDSVVAMIKCNFSNNIAVEYSGVNYEIGGLGGAIFLFTGELTLNACLIQNNRAGGNGGGVYVEGGSLVMLNCVIASNEAIYHYSFGGGVSLIGGELKATNCAFIGNTAFSGGGVFATNSSIFLKDCFFDMNVASLRGGAISTSTATIMAVVDCSVTNNAAVSGGGVYVERSNSVHLNAVMFSSNKASEGGGVMIEGDSTKVSMLGCSLERNAATGSSGGGMNVVGGTVSIVDSIFSQNGASGNTFSLVKDSTCSVKGGCFESSNFPDFYSPNDDCKFIPSDDGYLNVLDFELEELYDTLTVDNVYFYGRNGPVGVNIKAGSAIRFVSDPSVQFSGFSICYTVLSFGGGINIEGGKVSLGNVTMFENTATQGGGGLSMSGGSLLMENCRVENNTGLQGGAMFFASGSVEVKSLKLIGILGGASAAGTVCTSTCKQGTYGSCEIALGSRECYVNCQCISCPAGHYSSAEGATSKDDCEPCGSGQVSKAGASSCEGCAPGRYATDSSMDIGGGLTHQVPIGASVCNNCPSGYFSATASTLVCQQCSASLSSATGSSICDLSAVEFFLEPISKAVKPCPSHGICLGGLALPRPKVGYWIDRRKLEYSTIIYACLRDTCMSSPQDPDLIFPFSESCWSATMFGNALCRSKTNLCREGSFGPLCAACKDGYTLGSAVDECIKCSGSQNYTSFTVLGAILIGGIFGIVMYRHGERFLLYLESVPPFSIFKFVDWGMLKVAYSTFQIIGTISWNLSIKFPEPFASFVEVSSALRFNFISWDCISGRSSYCDRVILVSVAPVIVSALIGALFMFRSYSVSSRERESLAVQHVGCFLQFSYFILPTCSQVQFEGLNCMTLGRSDDIEFLRADSSVDCRSKRYQNFRIANIFFILIFQSIPLMWFILLKRVANRLNPPHAPDKLQWVIAVRSYDVNLDYLNFLWGDYLPNRWYYEVTEMYRRIMFIAVLPLFGTGVLRASVACLMGVLSINYCRELSPFIRPVNNGLLVVGQFQVFLTCLGALMLISGSSAPFGLHSFALGCILFAANFSLITIAVRWCIVRWNDEVSRKLVRFKHELSSQEFQIVEEVMRGSVTGGRKSLSTNLSEAFGAGVELPDIAASEMMPTNVADIPPVSRSSMLNAVVDSRGLNLNPKIILSAADVTLDKRIGAGTFGEVYCGLFSGSIVAVKTLLHVNEENARMFKAEICLTASLNHPNIVNFVGACWSRELTCLVLEWVPKGSLRNLLEDNSLNLFWGDPLLKLATDIARGMTYLHGRELYDDMDGSIKRTILHRDLKPDNVLVTDFLSSKISDFGTSRAKGDLNVTMTSVGTPLFAAPEIFTGSVYDEKVDVYSFGMLLLDMATKEPVLDFIGERWRIAHSKMTVPKQPMRFIRTMNEEGWRPVTYENPIPNAPATLNSLLIKCCCHNPFERPIMAEVLEALNGPIAVELAQSLIPAGRYSSRLHDRRKVRMSRRMTERIDDEDGLFENLNPMSNKPFSV